MELRTENGRLKPGGAFKLVALGYFFGAGAIFFPLFALVLLISLLAGVPTTVNGEVVEGGIGILAAVVPIFMLPFVLAIQAVMFGGVAALGLWLYSKRKPIRVIEG